MSISDFFDGLFGGLKSFGYISRHGLWKYCILPALVSVICAYFIYSFFAGQADWINNWLVNKYPWETGSGIIESVSNVLGKVVSVVGSLFVFKYLVLMISSPFMSLLSEKVETIEFGETETTWSMASLLSDLMRGIRISLRNLSREIFYVLLLMILSFFPVVGMITVVLTFLVQSYYAGFGNIDFFLERHYDVKNSARFVKQNRSYAAGLGAGFLLLSMTGIGLLFAAPLATVAATRKFGPQIV